MLEKIKNDKYLKNAVILLSALTIIRLIISAFVGLDGGPAYYAMWSTRLELSYFDHPLMSSTLVRLSTEIFGWNSFAIKFPGIMCYLITSIFLYKTVKELNGSSKGAFYATAIFNFIPWIASSFGIKALTPDIPFLMFYLMSFYYFVKLHKTLNPKYFYIIGVIAALGIMSKYKMVFVYPALLLAMIFEKKLHPLWKRKELYISAFIGLLGTIPILIYNFNHDFASFQYHLVQRQGHITFVPMDFIEFLGNQIAIMGIFVPIMLFAYFFKQRKTETGKLIFYFIAPAVFIFSFTNIFFGKSMQNWWASVYLILLCLYGTKEQFGKFDKFVLRFTVFVTIVGTTFYLHPFGVKLKQSSNFLDHHLFDNAAEDLSDIIKSYEEQNKPVYIGTPRYRTTAMLNVYMPEQKIYSMDYRKGDQFQLWYPSQELIGKNVIYFRGGSQLKQTPEKIFKYDNVKLIKKTTHVYNSKFQRDFYFYEIENYQGLK